MSSVFDSCIDKTEFEKRLMDINKQIKNLVYEQEEIELKLQKNFGNKKQCLSNNNNNNEKNNSNSNTQSSYNNANNNVKSEEEDEDEGFCEIINPANNLNFFQQRKTFDREILKNFDALKSFFEQTWNLEFLNYKIDYSDHQVTDREKAADIKIRIFAGGHYIDCYDEKIQTASFKQKDFDLPDDQFKAVVENLFDAVITRSKVLELFENCGKEAGQLFEGTDDGVSDLQVYNSNTCNLVGNIYSLLRSQKYFTWDYEKVKALFNLWQGCVISRGNIIDIEEEKDDDFFELYNELLDLLNKENLLLTKEQRAILLSILKAGKNFCNK